MNAILEADDFPLVDSVAFILALKGTSVPKFAKERKVSRQMVYAVLSGERKSKGLQEDLTAILGFEI